MFIRVSNDEIRNAGNIRRIARVDGVVTIFGEWDTFTIEEAGFDILDAFASSGVEILHLNGATTPKAVEKAATKPGAVAKAGKGAAPKAEPEPAPTPPTGAVNGWSTEEREVPVQQIYGALSMMPAQMNVAWSTYNIKTFGSDIYRNYPDDQLVRCANLIVESQRKLKDGTGDGYPWSVDSTYPKPEPAKQQPPVIDANGVGPVPGMQQHPAHMARIIVEMEELEKVKPDVHKQLYTQICNKYSVKDYHDLNEESQTGLILNLDSLHGKGILPELSAEAKQRVLDLTGDPFGDDTTVGKPAPTVDLLA